MWNRAVEVNGDYQTIAHIEDDGQIQYYVKELPDDVIQKIESAAETERKNAAFTAGYREYSKVKNDNPDCMVLYQVGDFFELYGEDAQTAAEVLGVQLTSHSIGSNQRVSMCGFPIHSTEQYAQRLLDAGYDVVTVTNEPGEGEPPQKKSKNLER